MRPGVSFNRVVGVDIAPPPTPPVLPWTDLRVDFNVKMSTSIGADEAQIIIHNPSLVTIAAAQAPGFRVRLRAGYSPTPAPQPPTTIFYGDIADNAGAKVIINGSDRRLEIQATGGAKALGAWIPPITFAQGTTFQYIVDTILANPTVALARGVIDPTVLTPALPRGIVLEGRVTDILDELARAFNAQVFVTDYALNILPPGAPVSPRVFVLDPTQGSLLGSPGRTSNGGWRFRTWLNPNIRPGKLVQVLPNPLAGRTEPVTVRATDVQFNGSNKNGKFECVIVGRSLVG